MEKYVYLALAMYNNRCDWSDGYSYVRDALKDFKIEIGLDQKIVRELNEIIFEYDSVDGRHFRDCDFNYNWIYENLLTDKEQLLYDEEIKKEW